MHCPWCGKKFFLKDGRSVQQFWDVTHGKKDVWRPTFRFKCGLCRYQWTPPFLLGWWAYHVAWPVKRFTRQLAADLTATCRRCGRSLAMFRDGWWVSYSCPDCGEEVHQPSILVGLVAWFVVGSILGLIGYCRWFIGGRLTYTPDSTDEGDERETCPQCGSDLLRLDEEGLHCLDCGLTQA